MFSTFFTVIPIFALIFTGFTSRRIGVFGAAATRELNRFVIYLALPTLLFDIVANTTWRAIYQPGFLAVFGLSCAGVFVLTVGVRLRRPRHLADASIDGLNAAYPNTGFIGLPLCLMAFGHDSLPSASVATVFTTCVLFAAAIILIEIGLQTERHAVRLLRKVAVSLIRNPLLIAPVLGAAFAATGLPMPDSAETFLKLLGGAASPCALVALGLFLAERRPQAARQTAVTGLLVALKLLAHPALAWVLAARVFGLTPLLTNVAVLMAALPTGTGPFMLAEFYRREADLTAASILVSTLGSLVTVSGYLVLASYTNRR